MRFASLGLAACFAAGVSSTCLGQDLPAIEQFSDTTIAFKIDGQFGTLMLTVAGPNGYYASATARTASPIIELDRFGRERCPIGITDRDLQGGLIVDEKVHIVALAIHAAIIQRFTGAINRPVGVEIDITVGSG